MKLTKSQLKKIIKEEMSESIADETLEEQESETKRFSDPTRKERDRARAQGTAAGTPSGREIKMKINQMKKDGRIDKPTWRKARRALYKDKTGDMAIAVLVDAIGRGEVEGAFGGGFDDDNTEDITAAPMRALRNLNLKESKLTKSMLKQLIKEELENDQERARELASSHSSGEADLDRSMRHVKNDPVTVHRGADRQPLGIVAAPPELSGGINPKNIQDLARKLAQKDAADIPWNGEGSHEQILRRDAYLATAKEILLGHPAGMKHRVPGSRINRPWW